MIQKLHKTFANKNARLSKAPFSTFLQKYQVLRATI
jgi:transcription initiation factor IIF auxiliary subunit